MSDVTSKTTTGTGQIETLIDLYRHAIARDSGDLLNFRQGGRGVRCRHLSFPHWFASRRWVYTRWE
ncbi:MAG: hypothetical protein IPO77_07245 [Acidobacteria bacterium]|nr:hypothetical protein [Acidobacteriota bacterium]